MSSKFLVHSDYRQVWTCPLNFSVSVITIGYRPSHKVMFRYSTPALNIRFWDRMEGGEISAKTK